MGVFLLQSLIKEAHPGQEKGALKEPRVCVLTMHLRKECSRRMFPSSLLVPVLPSHFKAAEGQDLQAQKKNSSFSWPCDLEQGI